MNLVERFIRLIVLSIIYAPVGLLSDYAYRFTYAFGKLLMRMWQGVMWLWRLMLVTPTLGLNHFIVSWYSSGLGDVVSEETIESLREGVRARYILFGEPLPEDLRPESVTISPSMMMMVLSKPKRWKIPPVACYARWVSRIARKKGLPRGLTS